MARFEGLTVNPAAYGIEPLDQGGNRNSEFGFLQTVPEDDTTDAYSTLTPDFSCRAEIIGEVESRALRRPPGNRERNG